MADHDAPTGPDEGVAQESDDTWENIDDVTGPPIDEDE